MVKKLYKHEFLAWLRVLPIFFAVTLLTAAFHRLFQAFESDSIYYNIASISALLLYVVSIMVTMAAPTVFGVVRFYKNLFTGEGYLTFTLPVKTTTHLNVKVVTTVVFSVAAMVTCALSACIITAGDVFTELWKAFLYLWNLIYDEFIPHLIGYAAEVCVLMLVALFASALLYNSCLCIGQLAKKNRILLAVGAYFIYYIITQIFSTIFIMVFTGLEMAQMLESYYVFIAQHPYVSIHIGLCAMILLDAALAFVFWLICRFILKKKLNLE